MVSWSLNSMNNENRVNTKQCHNHSLFSGIAYFARLISPLFISPNNEDCLSGALLIFQWVQRQPNYIVSLPFFVLCALPSIDTFHWLGTLKSTPTRTPRVFNLLLHHISILQFFRQNLTKVKIKWLHGEEEIGCDGVLWASNNFCAPSSSIKERTNHLAISISAVPNHCHQSWSL